MRKPGVGAVKKKQNRSFFSFKYHLAEEGGGLWYTSYPKYILHIQNKTKQNKNRKEEKKQARFQVWIPNTSWCMHAAAEKRLNTKCRSEHRFGIRGTLCRHISTLHSSLNNKPNGIHLFLEKINNVFFVYIKIKVGARGRRRRGGWRSVRQSELTDAAVLTLVEGASWQLSWQETKNKKLSGLQTSLLALLLYMQEW